MAAASAVRPICLIDPESCLTNVCTCVDVCGRVWTCERVNMTLVFFIQGLTCLLFIFITHARTPWTSCTIVCKKFLLTNMSLQLRCLSSQPCGNLSFFLDLDFGAVSEISDCPTNAGATTLDSDKSTAFESTWYAMLVDYRNSPITMKQKNND